MAFAKPSREIRPVFTKCPITLLKRYCSWYQYCQMNPANWDRDQEYPACAAQFACFSKEQWDRIRQYMRWS